jgi:hypothetical protein
MKASTQRIEHIDEVINGEILKLLPQPLPISAAIQQ